MPAEVLATFPCKSHIFRKRVKKLIISEEKWRVFEAWWRNVQKCREVKNEKWCVVKWSEVKWSESMNVDEIRVLSFIYMHVALCRLRAVRFVITICFSLLFFNYSTYVFNILFVFVFLFCTFVFYFAYSVFLDYLCIVSPFVYSCRFPSFVQVYRPLPPGGKPIAVNKYHHHHHHYMCAGLNLTDWLLLICAATSPEQVRRVWPKNRRFKNRPTIDKTHID